MKNRRILNISTFPILQVDYSPDNFLIEYRHLPHESLTQDLLSHKKWARLRAKNEIGQISSETENLAILLYKPKVIWESIDGIWLSMSQLYFQHEKNIEKQKIYQ